MTIDRVRRLERRLPGLFEELADAHTPDYLEGAIERASSRSQRPAWTLPGRWFPMEIVTTRVPTTRLPWRQVGMLALLALVLAAVLGLVIGSNSTRLPAPFGPAANGVIAVTQNGDLYTVEPQTGALTLLVGGPETDEWIDFTPDGTRGVFLRWEPEHGAMTSAKIGSVALRGGEEPVFIEKDVIHEDSWIQVAPNGRDVAFTAFDFSTPELRIHVASLDGTEFRQFSEVPITDYGALAYLGPDGRELVYVARSSNAQTHDIRALDVTTGTTRSIVETSLGNDIFGNVTAAPDGQHIAYALQTAAGTINIHVIGTDGTDDKVVAHAAGANFEAWPLWDPQGTRLLIERDAGDGVIHPVIVGLDGRPDVVIDAVISPKGAGKSWAPDGASILAQRTAADGWQLQQELWNARTGAVTPVIWPSVTGPAWQRLAP